MDNFEPHIVGTDKVGFVTIQKHGSTSLNLLIQEYDFITNINPIGKGSIVRDKDFILLCPLRDQFELIKSGFIQDLINLYDFVKNEDLKKLLKVLFDKKNKFDFFNVSRGHKILPFIENGEYYFFMNNVFLDDNWDGCKWYFFNMNYLSDERLINWISEHDDRWKGVSIPKENTRDSSETKSFIYEIFEELKIELGEDYNDFGVISNWRSIKHYYSFILGWIKALKKSKYFLNIKGL
jgi:hypothetical protein